jgi:hypothetical protein
MSKILSFDNITVLKIDTEARSQWLMPVILVNQKAEIRRIAD